MTKYRHRTLVKFLAATLLALTAVACIESPAQTTSETALNAQAQPQDIIIKSIYWSDGDSGRINGSLKFRLNDIDAPETGGVGAAVGGAKCEAERAKGYESKAWAVAFTKMPSSLSLKRMVKIATKD